MAWHRSYIIRAASQSLQPSARARAHFLRQLPDEYRRRWRELGIDESARHSGGGGGGSGGGRGIRAGVLNNDAKKRLVIEWGAILPPDFSSLAAAAAAATSRTSYSFYPRI